MIDRPPFFDAHVHFFDMAYPSLRYAWLEPAAEPDPDLGDYSAIKSQRYWPDDFLGETRFANVTGMVHVQAAVGTADPVDETAWLERHAARVGIPSAIVAYVDLSGADARDQLERHAEHAHVCGIRDLRYDDYLESPQWRAGYALLEEFGFICCDDPLLEHVPSVVALLREFPGITLCVDHAGFPRRRDEAYFKQWRACMASLAACDNAVMKISGLGMGDHQWTVDSIRPWVSTCIELFGVKRCCFGTNWPIDRLFSSYTDVVDAYCECIADLSPSEQAALMRTNAMKMFSSRARVS